MQGKGNPRRRVLLAAANILFALLVLGWAVHTLPLADVWSAAVAVPATVLLQVVGVNLLLMAVYGARTALLAECGFARGTAVVWLGFGLNSVLPMRLGDVARLAYARQIFGIPVPRMVVVAALEKVFDVMALLALGLATMQLVSFASIGTGVSLLAALLALALVVLALALVLPARWVPLRGRVREWAAAAVQTLRAQLSTRRIAAVAFCTVLIWTLTVISTSWMFAPLYPQFRAVDACVLTLVLVLALAVPGAPAGLGVFEAAIAGYLHSVLGVPLPQAVAGAIVFHLCAALPQAAGAVAILLAAAARKPGGPRNREVS